jgi:diguanylate cyclase (GGDEF)-like protein/PAS domain S-box-containing protein
MPEREQPGVDVALLLAEIARQNKVIQALMNRVEHCGMGDVGSDYDAFQAAITIERQVRRRTAELERALRENERMTRALRESEARFRSVVDQPLVGIAVIDTNGRFAFTNARLDEIFGYSAEELAILELPDLAAEEDKPKVAEQLRQRVSREAKTVDYTFRGRRKDGADVDIEAHSSVTELGEKRVFVSVILDVSDRMRAERETQALYDLLREQSNRDALTGLFNRRYLDASLERELIVAIRGGHSVSLVMGDIDHFKSVNDRYGHLAGDEVLSAFAAQMTKFCRANDLACRYGGEEFALVMPGMTAAKARERAEQLRAAIEAMPVRHGDAVIAVTASFGVASCPECGKTQGDLVTAADKALYAAKRGGRNQVGFVSATAPNHPTIPQNDRALVDRPFANLSAA